MTEPREWVKVLDQDKCIRGHACMASCKGENEVPPGATRTDVKSVRAGIFPQVRRTFQVTRRNQCADAPCTLACPYDAIFINSEGNSAAVLGPLADLVSGAAADARVPRGHRGLADLGPASSCAVLPDPYPASWN